MAEDERPRKKKRRKRAEEPAAPPPIIEAAIPETHSRFAMVWVVVAALYLATVWLDGVGASTPRKLSPRPWLYFSQIAALFVNAAPKVIDYRAEGWFCADHQWKEIDVRPYFRIDEDNKENRFQRALQFYRKNRTVMRALEDYVTKRYNETHEVPIAGVRFSSLRLDYPPPGAHVSPFTHEPLTTYSGEQKHDWYFTPGSKRAAKCGDKVAPKEESDDAPTFKFERADPEQQVEP